MLACAYTHARPLPTLGATRSTPATTAPAPPLLASQPPPVDLCPDADETPNNDRDADGCPDEQVLSLVDGPALKRDRLILLGLIEQQPDLERLG